MAQDTQGERHSRPPSTREKILGQQKEKENLKFSKKKMRGKKKTSFVPKELRVKKEILTIRKTVQ